MSKPALGKDTKSCNPPSADSKYKLQDSAASLLGSDYRVSFCCRAMMKHEQVVNVVQHKSGALSYGNLVKCGSVWVCPVCAAKISTHRRQELGELVENAMAAGNLVGMLTLTVPHGIGDNLKDILKRMCDAKRKMQNRKTWKRFSSACGLVGEVRCLEVTHGSNGWHPHFHLLLFFRSNKDVRNVKRQVLEMWQSACESVGLDAPNNHGVSFSTAQKSVSGYICKFGIDAEMTQGHLKEGRKSSSRSPFRLLKDYRDGDKQAGALFAQYAKAFKSKRQLVYSKGLRRRFGLAVEMTDDEIMDQPEVTKVVYVLTKEQWLEVCRLGKRGKFLENFARHLLMLGVGPIVGADAWHSSGG